MSKDTLANAELRAPELPSEFPQRRAFWYIAAVLVLILATWFRIWHLQLESLEGDEIFSRSVAMMPLTSAAEAIRTDLVHPPFYYLLLKAALVLTGSDPAGVRIISLFAGILTVGLITVFGWVFPRWRVPAFIAAALLSVNDEHIFYSQQARSYALFALSNTLLLLWTWLITRYGDRFGFWLLGSILMTSIVYIHYVGALYVGAIVAGIWCSTLPKKVKLGTLLSAAVAAVLFLPWVWIEVAAYRQKHGVMQNLGWQTPTTLANVKEIWATFIGIPDFRGGTMCALLVGLGLAGAALYYSRGSGARHIMAVLAASTFLPGLALAALSLKPFSLPVFGDRHVLPSVVPMLLLVSLGAYELFKRYRLPGTLTGVVTLLITLQLSSTVIAMKNGPRRTSYASVAADLASIEASSFIEVYTTCPWVIGDPVNYYFHRAVIRPLPDSLRALPSDLVLLYRPTVRREVQDVVALSQRGYLVESVRNYKPGSTSGFAVASLLMHQGFSPPPSAASR